MKKYDLAIFDLDGTILDTLQDLSDSLNYALLANGYPARTLDEARRFVGNGIRRLVERGVPAGTDGAAVEKVLTDFKAHYQRHSMDATRPYEGIESLLTKLRADGMALAVVSNKIDAAVGALCQRFFPGLFDLSVGERPGVAKKPAPDAVNEVLKTLGIPRERAVYIGDSDVDIQTARNADLDALIVTWGFRDERYLKEQGAERLVASPDALYEALQG